MIKFKAIRAFNNFSTAGLIQLIRKYPTTKHLKEALNMKGEKIKIYVTSPYDTLLNRGFKLDYVFKIAKKATKQAKSIFKGDNYVLYSPVLDMGAENISRKEAMKRCFKELKKCTFVFVPNVNHIANSKGVLDEVVYAKKNNIGVIFADSTVRIAFKSEGKL